jgi:hypothetical protein
MDIANNKLQVGWREWVKMPDLGIKAIKVKIDTGARTSALHATNIEEFVKSGELFVRFETRPYPRYPHIIQHCQAPVLGKRVVKSSTGHEQNRYVIKTLLQIGELEEEIEITLTNRERMLCNMLLGRTAMKNMIVYPQSSFLNGKVNVRKLLNIRKANR